MSDDFTKFKEAVEVLVQRIEDYEKRSSKAASKRVRVAAGVVKSLTTAARKALLERDKTA